MGAVRELLVFLGGLDGKESACKARNLDMMPGWEDPLEKALATHSSILVWRIPWRSLAYRPWGHKELDITE